MRYLLSYSVRSFPPPPRVRSRRRRRIAAPSTVFVQRRQNKLISFPSSSGWLRRSCPHCRWCVRDDHGWKRPLPQNHFKQNGNHRFPYIIDFPLSLAKSQSLPAAPFLRFSRPGSLRSDGRFAAPFAALRTLQIGNENIKLNEKHSVRH